MTHRVLKSHRSKTSIIYMCEIMKTMCPPGYHHNGFVATHALGHPYIMCIYIIYIIYIKYIYIYLHTLTYIHTLNKNSINKLH